MLHLYIKNPIGLKRERYIYLLTHLYNMKEDEQLEIPKCDKCGSTQIRTTSKYRICIRCGYKEKLK